MGLSHAPIAAFRQGAIGALKLPAWIVGASLMGVGPLARDVGFPFLGAILSTVLVWAGPAQVVFFATLGAGASVPAIALAVTLTAIRLTPMTASLMPHLRAGGASRATLLAASHFVAVTTWVESMRRLPALPPEIRLPYFFGFGAACMAVATCFTAVGYALAGEVPASIGAGLLFMTPTFFTLSLLRGASIRADWLAIGAGFALTALFGIWLGPAAALFLAGLLGGTAAFMVERAQSEEQ
ncbi:MAG: AzlC family ABC transporter permease [Beijerinckiaceae bacterium]